MAIKEFITLEGVEEIETKLKRLNALGEDSLANFRNLGSAAGGTGDPFSKFVDGAKNAGLELQATSRHANTLREALHVLHPILQIAGARAGELGSFARLAGAGLSALAIAAGGVVVVGLANLEEQAKKTKAALTGLLGTKDAGNQAFGALEKAAKGLNTGVEDLAPAFQSATTALQRFKETSSVVKFVGDVPAGVAGNVKTTLEAIQNLFKIIRAGGQDSGEASKSAKAFFDTMKEGGKLTADALKQLDPGAVLLIGKAWGSSATSAEQFIKEVALLGGIPVDKLIERLAKFSEEAQKAFDANAVKSFKDEFNAFIRDSEKDFKDLFDISFSDFIINSLQDLRRDVKQFIADIKAAVAFVKSVVNPPAAAPIREAAIAEAEKLTTTPPFKLSDIFGDARKAEQAVIELGDKSKQSATVGKIAWDEFAKSITNITDTAVTSGEQMLRTWQAVQSAEKAAATGPTNRFVVPPGADPFAGGGGAIARGQQAATATAIAAQVTSLVQPFQTASEQIKQLWADLLVIIESFGSTLDISSIIPKLVGPFQQAAVQISAIIDSIIIKIQTLDRAIQLNANPFIANQPTSLAGGGYVRGPGTTTSDSIMAWLSDMEYVINARAVRHYGADLFGALNAMALPKDFINRFAMGGLARSAGNRLASGGQVSSGNSVTLKIDRHTFNMTAGDDTVAAIKRFAVAAQISSTGRKPRFVR